MLKRLEDKYMFIYSMFIAFFPNRKVFGEQQYLHDAMQCGEVIWHRGLLKKGYGLCHGAAGNAYAFLALYKLTQEPRHLYRACVVTPFSGYEHVVFVFFFKFVKKKIIWVITYLLVNDPGKFVYKMK